MTFTLKGTEVIADAAIEKLKAGMPARIAAINSEKADNIRVEPPSDDAYYAGTPDPLAQVPAVFVTELSGPEFEYEGVHSFSLGTNLAVVVVEEDGSRDLLIRKLWRQSRAVIEVLWDDEPKQQLEGSAWRLAPMRLEPGPIFDPQALGTSYWRQPYAVIFSARQLEGD